MVYGGSGDPVAGQGVEQSWLVDAAAPRDVDEVSRWFHGSERCGVDDPAGVGGQRTAQRNEVGPRQKRRKFCRCMDLVGLALVSRRIAFDPDHRHTEGLREPCQTFTDCTQTDDQQVMPDQIVLAVRYVRDHAAPETSALIVAPGVELADEAKHKSHRVLTDRIGIHTGGVGQQDVSLTQLLQRKLVVAGTDRLNVTKTWAVFQEHIVPETGDHQYIGLRQSGKRLFVGPGLFVTETGAELGETLCHLVGGVREQDVRL